MEKPKYEVSEELLNAILQYLSNKPYVEVAPLIAEIMKLKIVNKGE